MFASLLSTPGLSFYSIPAAWALAIHPHVVKNLLIDKHIGRDNIAPRDNVKHLEQKQVSPEVLAKARRLEGAHQNGWEALPLWIGAVLAANFTGVDQQLLNTISLAFLVSRFVYNKAYERQTTIPQSAVRSIVWIISTSLCLYLYVKAGNMARSA